MKKELTHRIYKEKMSGLISDLFILSRTCQDRHVANMIARHASSIQDLLFDMSIELDTIKEEICDVMQSQCSLNFDHHFRSRDLLKVLEKIELPDSVNIEEYSKFEDEAHTSAIKDTYKLSAIIYKLS